jgi:hypothetical protein
MTEVMKNKQVLIYNSAFDIKILNYCCKWHGLPILNLKERSERLMKWAAQWRGDWSYSYEDYKYFPINGNHRALLRLSSRSQINGADASGFGSNTLFHTDSREHSIISQSMPSSGNRDNCPGDTLDCPRL